MAAAGVAGVSNSHGQRTRIPHGNTRAKLSDYIGQVFECKANNPSLLTQVRRKLARRARQTTVRDPKFKVLGTSSSELRTSDHAMKVPAASYGECSSST